MHFREIMLDFFEKVSLAWEDALRYTISFMFVNVPYVYPYLTVKIFSHQQLPGSVYWDLTADSKLKRLTTYLGTVFSFGTFIRQENPACRFLKLETILSRFLQNLLTPYLHLPNYPWLKWYRNLLYREPKSERWSEECLKGQINLFIYTLLTLLYSVLTRYRLFRQSFFRTYRMNQSILEKIFNK